MTEETLLRVRFALNEYEKLTKKFQTLITDHEILFETIPSVTLKETSTNSLIIEIFGIEILIRYSLVFENENPLGQVSALVNSKPFNTEPNLYPVHTIWFDSLGNIQDSPSNSKNIGHISYGECLPNFIHSVIYKLMKSDYMAPLK